MRRLPYAEVDDSYLCSLPAPISGWLSWRTLHGTGRLVCWWVGALFCKLRPEYCSEALGTQSITRECRSLWRTQVEGCLGAEIAASPSLAPRAREAEPAGTRRHSDGPFGVLYCTGFIRTVWWKRAPQESQPEIPGRMRNSGAVMLNMCARNTFFLKSWM